MGCDSYEVVDDPVYHPHHYTSHPAGIEALDVLRWATDYDIGQAMKYCWRVMWGSKGRDLEDIQKAVVYLQDWVKHHE